MALKRKDKEQLVENYKQIGQWVKNIIVLKQHWLPVNEINKVRMDITDVSWRLIVVKKRIFLKYMKENWFQEIDLSNLQWSVVALYAYEDEYAPLKVVSKYSKLWDKEKLEYWYEYLGWWFDNEWRDAQYIKTMADMPSKEELVGKLLWLMNYPMQGLVMCLDQLSKKNGWWEVEVKSEQPAQEAPVQEETSQPEVQSEQPVTEAQETVETQDSNEW